MTTPPAWATEAFAAACAAEDIDLDAAEFLRVGTYATWIIPSFGLVARVAATPDAALVHHEYVVATALADAEIPVATPARQSYEHITGVVGWWALGEPTTATWTMLGNLTRTLHDRSAAWLVTDGRGTPRCDLVAQADTRLVRAQALLPDLRAELDQARQRLHDLTTEVSMSGRVTRVIAHGDLSPHNVLADGRLIDLETAGVGEPAIDLARIVSAVERYNAPLSTLTEFAAGYGCDLTAFAAPRVQAWWQIRDLWATAWAAAYADRSPEIATEARLRLTSFADPSVPWNLI